MAITTSPSPRPIVIAGGGCVGLFLALLLTHSPIHNPIIVLEPSAPDPTSTRAMAHQPPTFPLLSRVPGLLDELIAAGSLSRGLCFRTSTASGSRVIAGKTFGAGEKGQLLLPQGVFQEVLLKRLEGGGGRGAEVRLGWAVSGVEERGTGVEVRMQDADGKEESVLAEYLIGADGAHSTVRRLLGVGFEGETLDAQLVATDVLFDFQAHGFYDANFIIDPVNYGLVGRINNDGLWRVSYGVPVDTSEEEIRRGVHDKLRHMMPGDGKDGFEVVRVAPYKAQQRCVSTFWKGRVGLVGDAAHLTNPYAGLGLASGIADASSLSQVLIHILSQDSSDDRHSPAADSAKLLASWSDARRQKFLNVVDKPSRMAYARVKSKTDTEEDVQNLLARDRLVGALKKGMPMMPPSLETKGDELDGW
ncbi:FAD/NAD(P)-binding domain-containing protein [Dothidotthia symphoricarpi CBS 119687]|uniref:FAD/NAD(P)-binding domain-containing protein n=1 Tax=Dothidotthia symphoricarpi CBS 119687 TaxID=1392245 RepID=A0A6A6A8S6_9PLEO|nr:FAD/NAD(P)-binding domain-containing protein [Dothidotthia symphoricarpi CBS 119687]KAF2127227.1 FAD/NAD(P)-binding domain-containing protein [Dothidotthia symphoricarpi CBS 119687]